MGIVTRFAPSPTGLLHLGHAFSAITAHDMARRSGGRFLIRIEDIDPGRAHTNWTNAALADLEWLGLTWDGPVLAQSTRLAAYRAALDRLTNLGLLFGCTCTRGDVRAALSAPQEGAELPIGPDGLIYPGTCRANPPADHAALRLNMAKAVGMARDLRYQETGKKPQGIRHLDPADLINKVGDIVLARRDMGTSYHLSVVVDDDAQGITHVTRGDDLSDATQIHVILQALLGLPTPVYHHHALIRDDQGKRLAKRDDARSIRSYRDQGATPADIRAMLGLTP